jgi:hypothetical protein
MDRRSNLVRGSATFLSWDGAARAIDCVERAGSDAERDSPGRQIAQHAARSTARLAGARDERVPHPGSECRRRHRSNVHTPSAAGSLGRQILRSPGPQRGQGTQVQKTSGRKPNISNKLQTPPTSPQQQPPGGGRIRSLVVPRCVALSIRHSRVGGNPASAQSGPGVWIPAYAGMTGVLRVLWSQPPPTNGCTPRRGAVSPAGCRGGFRPPAGRREGAGEVAVWRQNSTISFALAPASGILVPTTV